MGCNSSSSLLSVDADGIISQTSTQQSSQTRILQDDVVDYCVSQPAPPEPTSEYLSQGEFIDGMLGLCNTDLIIEKLTNLSQGELFNDDEFPAEASSLSFSSPEDTTLEEIEWKRPYEISHSPYLFVDGTSRVDVKQGDLGDCWFLSACASVAKRQELIEKVIDPSQRLFGDGYIGALLIHFWRFGEWVTVHIDDRLPTKNGQLLYASSTDSNEYWLALVEKAYAKLHGSYEALSGGHALEAFVDLTGGIAENMQMTKDFFPQLKTIFLHGAFITCSRKSDKDGHRCKSGGGKGIVQGHAYTVTSVAIVDLISGGKVYLVRVRNPWGDSVEWEGAWSDRSKKWENVTDEDKKKLRVTAMDDGEFWMNFEDFQDQFQNITVATLGPDFDQDGISDTPKQVNFIKSSWKRGINSGGSRNDLEKFSMNPQYLLTLTETDEGSNEGKCSILVGLMQEHRRSEKHKRVAMSAIAIFIYKTETPKERLSAEYFLCVPEEATSGDFTNSREVIVRTQLEPGTYVIIPATFYSDTETNFLIRVFAVKPFTLTEIKNETDIEAKTGVCSVIHEVENSQENPSL